MSIAEAVSEPFLVSRIDHDQVVVVVDAKSAAMIAVAPTQDVDGPAIPAPIAAVTMETIGDSVRTIATFQWLRDYQRGRVRTHVRFVARVAEACTDTLCSGSPPPPRFVALTR